MYFFFVFVIFLGFIFLGLFYGSDYAEVTKIFLYLCWCISCLVVYLSGTRSSYPPILTTSILYVDALALRYGVLTLSQAGPYLVFEFYVFLSFCLEENPHYGGPPPPPGIYRLFAQIPFFVIFFS